MDREIRNILLMALALVLIGILMSIKGAQMQRRIWNVCHPELILTTSQVWWGGKILRVSECNPILTMEDM